MKPRWEKCADWLRTEGITGAFITSTPNVFYLTGFMCHPHERLLGIFLFPEAEPFLVCPKMEERSARGAGWTGQVIGYDDVQDPWTMIAQELVKRGVSASAVIAIEKEQLSYARGEKLAQLLPQARFVSADETMNQLRLVKDETELHLLREAAEIADQAVEVGISNLRLGCTELDVVAQIELAMKKLGIREMSFPTTVLFGEKTAAPHGVPGTRTLQAGDFALFDLGVVLGGYCSDITRTVAFGQVSEEQRRIYETVLQAQLAALDACHPGAQIGEVDRTARRIISAAGYGEYFPHRLGHGLGIDVHEFPSMNETNTDRLQVGMVFTVEPGIYVPEVGGVRIEDDVVITEQGHETLTRLSKELRVV